MTLHHTHAEEGRHALRDRNASEALLRNASNVVEKLSQRQMDGLLDTIIRIGPGAVRDATLLEDLGLPPLLRALARCSTWAKFKLTFPGELRCCLNNGGLEFSITMLQSIDVSLCLQRTRAP